MSHLNIGLYPVFLALIATLFTWSATALGAATVFLTHRISHKLLDGMLGFAAGVMIAASYFSLLAPALELSQGLAVPAWFPSATGVLLGAIFLRGIDLILPHLHAGPHGPSCQRQGSLEHGPAGSCQDSPPDSRPVPGSGRRRLRWRTRRHRRGHGAEGLPTSWRRTVLLVLAFALHNLPEGLTVGVAFGATGSDVPAVSLAGAVALGLGMALQNLPEGMAVALPLRREGLSPLKSFWYGQLSGVVEPVAGVLGAMAVLACRPILPYALSFAAGAMIFVVVEELVPECQNKGNSHLATMGAMVGFTVMLILAVALE